MEIKIYVPYKIIYSDDSAINKLNLDPYAINEGLIDSNDYCLVDVNTSPRILDLIKNYLSCNSNNNA